MPEDLVVVHESHDDVMVERSLRRSSANEWQQSRMIRPLDQWWGGKGCNGGARESVFPLPVLGEGYQAAIKGWMESVHQIAAVDAQVPVS